MLVQGRILDQLIHALRASSHIAKFWCWSNEESPMERQIRPSRKAVQQQICRAKPGLAAVKPGYVHDRFAIEAVTIPVP